MIILSIISTAIFVFFWQEYRYAIIIPVKMEMQEPKAGLYEWQDFITASINTCLHEEHCLQCTSLIHLFDRKFRRFTPPEQFNKKIERLWNQLNTKYTAITSKQAELSDVTIAHLLKEKL